MKKLVLGSLNIDCTYQVEDFVRPKETISALHFERFCGGKGFNQAVALARAGSETWFAGVLGADGGMLLEAMQRENIRTELLRRSETPNGHAVIEVNRQGENCIIIVAGSNGEVTCEYIDEVLSRFSAGDLIVLQNEVPHVDYAITAARKKGMVVAFNPSPFNDAIAACRLTDVDFLLIHEVEGQGLTGESEPEAMLRALEQRCPDTAVVLTLGEKGSVLRSADGSRHACDAVRCKAVDTTAAGDTFTGFFLTEYLAHGDAGRALRAASTASSIAVSRKGASPSIPTAAEVAEQMKG